MSSKLWQYFLQDDVEGFRRFLEIARSAQGQKSGGGGGGGNAGSNNKFGGSAIGAVVGTSPGGLSKGGAKAAGVSPRIVGSEKGHSTPGGGAALSRAATNVKDQYGRTLLHLIASSQKPTAIDFATALLEVPNLDIYAQDLENGWTSLHRALYSGNVAIAHALMARDVRDVIDFSNPGGINHRSGGLIKVKDWEGNSPFDLYGTTITYRDIKQDSRAHDNDSDEDDDSSQSSSDDDQGPGTNDPGLTAKHPVNLGGDEVFTFGSNKNLSLGLGDQDDRQYPERVNLTRPEHLLHRFHREHQAFIPAEEGDDTDELPSIIRSKPIVFQDIIMSKLHTAILTNDPESNLFMCGFGPGGRLGTGDEATRFRFECIETGGLSGKKVATVALGQDHSIAISEQGEVFTWGSNKFGQLGYNLPRTNQKNDTPIQTTPRQIFNPFKKETILGAAASSIHSVVFSTAGLYTFGKNEGQLGLVDADARSLGVQVLPRRVAATLFSVPIAMVSAIDRATTCLLENHDVWVFTHYGYSKLIFPLDETSSLIKNSFMITRYQSSVNQIMKITSGGSTICAMSSFGEVYTVNVSQKVDTSSTAASTTNPAKIRNALPQPSRVWSIKKSHMAVRDVDVGQDGSIIICTDSGSAWRKEKRAKIKDTTSNASDGSRTKDYKFVRVPGLSRVVAVRSNAFGAYAAAQRDCDVTKRQIHVDNQMLWNDLFQLLPFKDLRVPEAKELEVASPEGGPAATLRDIARIKNAVIRSSDIESAIHETLQSSDAVDESSCTIWLSTTTSDIRIPVHEFILTGRGDVLRQALAEFRKTYYYSIQDVLAIEYDKDGEIQIQFQGVDFLSILNLAFYIYSDNVLDVWHQARYSAANAFRYKQVRIEVMKIAVALELRSLERAARVMIRPSKLLHLDMEYAIRDPSFFDSGDLLLELDGSCVKVHSQLMAQRCPFFEGLFHGRSGGRWLSARRELSADISDTIDIDLKHIDPDIFHFVLRHIYADTGEELFENVKAASLDDFIDLVLDVMSVANELMIERLSQICQKILGRFVNTRNVCHLLNAIAPCSVTEFKDAAFEYICLNLEAMLENRLLDDLDEDLLHELVEVCRGNQFDYQPVSRGRNQEEYILEKYPEIVSLLEQDRQRRIDAINIRSRREIYGEPSRGGVIDAPVSPLARKGKVVPAGSSKIDADSPILRAKQSAGDLMFQMDDESILTSGTTSKATTPKPDLREEHSATLSPRLEPIIQGSSFNSRSDLDSEDIHGMNSMLNQRQTQPGFRDLPLKEANLSTEKPTSSLRPWSAITVPSSKTGLKDIMAESSATKSPQGTSAGQEGSHARNFSPKLSQKERKRLQQQQQIETSMSQPSFKSSPWQTVGKSEGKSSIKSMLSEASQDQPKTSTPDRIASKPSMTLRQTVAGTPPPSQNKSLNPPKSQNRSVSSPISMPSPQNQSSQRQATPNPTPSSLTASPGTPRSIQTVRHASKNPNPIVPSSSLNNSYNKYTSSPTLTPTPSNQPLPSTSHLSLASILYQQQTEKDEIREAATAKHNLQEIQMEQEFQQWWDQESKRVMEQAEADAAAVAAATTTGTSGTGRSGGGRGGRGKGRGGGGGGGQSHGGRDRGRGGGGGGETSRSNARDDAPAPAVPAGRRKPDEGTSHRDGGGAHRRGHHRGRGGGGGRGGRGKEKAAREQPIS
ncbi:hypothetical protein FQN54_001515 [Arachnomyces sp. PD_36]|nr:hypothetical protein FQN54_001515 [Arachnomyces sp. PD_36]